MKIVHFIKKSAQITCERCGSVLEYDFDDVYTGADGCKFITCPVCGEEIMLENLDPEKITSNTVKYPTHFYDFSNGVDVSDKEINEYIKQVCNNVEAGEQFSIIATGNTMVCALDFDGDGVIEVIVAKGYRECYVDKE